MNILIASDIHGSASWAQRLADESERLRPDRIVLLGDLLYHGPRNALPQGYDPMRVAEILNGLAASGRLLAVRGNCDAEVDQMVLDFPCMADFAQLVDDAGRTLFFTHGHIHGAGFHNSVDTLPALPEESAVVFGHTHIKVNEAVPTKDSEVVSAKNGEVPTHPGVWAFNPGSLSIPKDGTHSLGWYVSGMPIEKAFSHIVLS